MAKLSEEVLDFFRKQGAKGGKLGGKKAAAQMTAKQRIERARKAAEVRWGVKTKAAKA
jgi:hypothetical protein